VQAKLCLPSTVDTALEICHSPRFRRAGNFQMADNSDQNRKVDTL